LDRAIAEPRAATIEAHTFGVWSVAMSGNCKTLTSVNGGAKTVKLWDAKTGKERAVLEGHTDDLCTVVFTPDGTSAKFNDLSDATLIWFPVGNGSEKSKVIAG
jgi:WD40 repeat protein